MALGKSARSVLCGFIALHTRPYRSMLEIDTDTATKIYSIGIQSNQETCGILGLLKPKRCIANFQVQGALAMA